MEVEHELGFMKLSSSENVVTESQAEEDTDGDCDSLPDNGEEEIIDELPESIFSYLQIVKKRSENAEKLILQDLESTDIWISDISDESNRLLDNDSDYLAQLASEYNEEPKSLKKRVLEDIEEDDRAVSICNVMDNGNQKIEDKTDDNDKDIRLCYIEVEESCRQKLQQWEKEQEECNELKRAALEAQKEILQREIKEQDEKRAHWMKELEKEHLRLNTLQEEKMEKLESELKRHQESLEEELQNHQSLIIKMEADVIEESKNLEEQMAKAKKQLEELQCKSAVKIQAAFRAHLIMKKYAHILQQKREERKKKKELQHRLAMEKKELEDKIKFKLEEKHRREEERKRNEELEKKRLEEAKRQEYLEQESRKREYEKRKNEEKLRLEKEKLVTKESKMKLETSNTLHASKNECPRKDVKQRNEHDCLQLEIVDNTVRDTYNKELMEPKQCDMPPAEINVEKRENHAIYADRTDNNDEPVSELKGAQKIPINDNSNITLSEQTYPVKDIVHTEEYIPSAQSLLSCSEEQGMQMIEVQPGHELKVNNATHVEPSVAEIAADTHKSSMITQSLVLLDHIEQKRLAWIKSCKPWSKTLRDNNKNNITGKTKQRKSFSAKKLPPLKENLILQNLCADLQQVTTLTLSDLSGCSLSTLSKCTKLRYLSLRRCGLTALDGLSCCKELRYIDVQENNINAVDCDDLENLNILLLSKNKITSIHGIEHCLNLMNLELSFNLITRIGGMESLKSLQRLVIDHNQLISTKGLERTPMLMYLDCSYNYLTELEGIQNCGLMQILKLQGNNLSEIPKLDNHVLLREIYLDDNNINTLKDMSMYWLPLLQLFSVAHNSLTQLVQLDAFVCLEVLDISNNCLSELKTVTMWLENCKSLRRLALSKNPFLQEANWRSTLLKNVPTLQFLNEEQLDLGDHEHPIAPPDSFLALCQKQLSNISNVWKLLNNKQCALSFMEKVEIYCNTLKEILKLSNEHRYAHEYGDIEVADRADSQPALDTSQKHDPVVHENRQIMVQQVYPLQEDVLLNNAQGDKVRNIRSISTQSLQTRNTITFATAKTKDHDSNLKKPVPSSQSDENRIRSATIVIQSLWRGYVVRRDIRNYAKLHEAAFVIQSAWHNYCSRKKFLQKTPSVKPELSELKKRSATVIQAAWKGFFLRKKLSAAFAAIEREELEDEFEEVNLDEFMFDENILEKSWSLDSTISHHRAIHLSSKPEQAKKSAILEGHPLSLQWVPQEAWTGYKARTVERELNHERSEKQNLSHVSSMKSNIDISFKSEKEEKISQEWGFKDASTAQLMLKRAQKMKSKQAKKLKMLDPAVRLALFKNNENKHAPEKPPKKVQPTKIEYFRGEEERPCSEKLARSRELTYQWLHTQCGDMNAADSTVHKCKRLLPELNQDILNGGRVQLVTAVSKEADDLELLSVKSGSTLTQSRKPETQRNSASSSRNVFTPEKVNSRPKQKERISFRDNPVQLSGGWGGGKKKGKPLNKH